MSERDHAAIDLLLTDLVLPDMSGVELGQRLRTLLPGLRTVFMSGYSESVVLPRLSEDETTQFISKPFTAGKLLPIVRDALDSKSPE